MSDMDPAIITAIVGGVALLLSSIGTLIVQIRGSAKTDRLLEKTEEIHTLTNGTMHQVQAAKSVLEERVTSLERALVEAMADKRIASMASDQAATDVRAAMASTPPGDPPP